MGFVGSLDNLDAWRRVRRWREFPPAPVESTVEDLEELADADAESLHVTAPPADLTWSSQPTSDKGLEEEAFTFPSPISGPYAENNTVHGIRLRQAGTERARSAVIMLHGGFAEGYEAERLLGKRLFAGAADVYCPAAPFHMQRQPAASHYSGQFLLSGDVVRLVRGFAQSAVETRALAASLREAGYEHVAVTGISLGGNATLNAAAYSELDATLAIAPATDPFHSIWQTLLGKLIRQDATQAGFSTPLVARAMRHITPAHVSRPRTNPDRITLVYGRKDVLTPPKQTQELGSAWGCPMTEYGIGHRTLALKLGALRRHYEVIASPQAPSSNGREPSTSL